METGSEEWKEFISKTAEVFGIKLNSEHSAMFAVYAKELLQRNKKTNLTGIIQPEETAVKHFADSIIPAQFIPQNPDRNANLLDIGSGAGFPGIPLKIVLKNLHVTLIDGCGKKSSFQNHIIRTLELRNIEALHTTAQDMKKSAAGKYDIIISRALGSLKKFVKSGLPLLAENGIMIAMKGNPAQAEIDEVLKKKSDLLQLSIKEYILPYIEAKRSVVMMKRA